MSDWRKTAKNHANVSKLRRQKASSYPLSLTYQNISKPRESTRKTTSQTLEQDALGYSKNAQQGKPVSIRHSSWDFGRKD